ncbi:glycosyltransferase [Oscillibacter sp.]|uniref:glycosyltransferase n=1 Tax=Oscillibacter sp. TaxID=1945593 RepID=UPI0028A98BC9|nr:glycosyltransferase [Oscillibacter sp.]
MIDVFVPVYNEKDNIIPLLDELNEKVSSDFRVLVVYDMDEDNTLPVLRSVMDKYSYSIVLQKNTYGRGAINAFRTAIQAAQGEYLVYAMADLADDLTTIDLMKGKLDAGSDVVVGSRYMEGGQRNSKGDLKAFLSRLSGVGMKGLTGIPTHDISNAYRMYRTEILRKIPITTDGHGGTIEILQKIYLAGYAITEVPDVWNDRVAGESQFKMGKWMSTCIYWCLYTIVHKWFLGQGKPRKKAIKREDSRV